MVAGRATSGNVLKTAHIHIRVAFTCLTLLTLATLASAQTWSTLGPGTGDLRRVVVAPSQSGTALAIPQRGGLFLTTNAGTSWQSIGGGLCDVHVNGAVFHPSLPTTIYVATGSAGVCRTIDGGTNWTALASGLPLDASGFPLEVDVVAVNPSTPGTLLAGTQIGIYRSVDGGGSWTAVASTGSQVVSIVISPSAAGTAYAASSNTILKSTDGGASWTAAATGLPSSFQPGGLTIDPTNAAVVYLAAGIAYKTSNGGAGWAAANNGIGAPLVGDIVIDPAGTNVLYAAASGGCGFCKSTNGGSSWSAIAASGLPSVSSSSGVVSSLAIDPGTPGRLYASTSVGAFRSSDSGLTWSAVNANLASREVSAPALLGGATPAPLLVVARVSNAGADVLKLTGGALPFTAVTDPRHRRFQHDDRLDGRGSRQPEHHLRPGRPGQQ